MKFRLWVSISLLFLVAGCQHKETDINHVGNVVDKIYAVIEDVETKTSLSAENKVLWSEGDEVSVFSGKTSGDRYAISASSAGSASAVFEYKEAAQGGERLDVSAAYYPYSSSLSISRVDDSAYEISGISLPEVQTYSAGSFGQGSFPMVAVGNEESYMFRNVCGAIRIPLTGDKAIRSITIWGGNSEYLSGEAKVRVFDDSSAPEIIMADDSGTMVTLDCGTDGVMLDPDNSVPFIISLPPTVFEDGFSVRITDVDGGEMEVSATVSNQIHRSGLLSMPSLEYTPEDSDALSVVIDAKSVTIDDIKIKVNIRNAVQYSGGYKLKSKFSLTDVVKEANWKIAPRMKDSFLFEGSLSQFPSGEFKQLSHGYEYVVWVAPYVEGQNIVSADDIVYKEFSLPELKPGAALDMSLESLAPAYTSLEVSLSSPGAKMIYASILTESEASSLTDSDSRYSYLLSNGSPKVGETVSFLREGLEPGVPLTIIAMAIDPEGRYSEIYEFAGNTSTPVYNEDIVIGMTVSHTGKTARIKLDAHGADISSYYYFCSKKTDTYWTRTLGGTIQSAEEYMTINPDSYLLDNTLDIPLKDGCVEIEQLDMEEDYVFVIMAVDADGVLSRAFMLDFVLHLDLGEFVYKSGSTLWSETKPAVNFGTCRKESGFYLINWNVTHAAGLKAYAVCAHPNTFKDCYSPEEIVVRIYNLGVEVVSGKTETMIYGDKEFCVYVTWCDADGNFYEASSILVPQN